MITFLIVIFFNLCFAKTLGWKEYLSRFSPKHSNRFWTIYYWFYLSCGIINLIIDICKKFN